MKQRLVPTEISASHSIYILCCPQRAMRRQLGLPELDRQHQLQLNWPQCAALFTRGLLVLFFAAARMTV
jgi:hypothetical protein